MLLITGELVLWVEEDGRTGGIQWALVSWDKFIRGALQKLVGRLLDGGEVDRLGFLFELLLQLLLLLQERSFRFEEAEHASNPAGFKREA